VSKSFISKKALIMSLLDAPIAEEHTSKTNSIEETMANQCLTLKKKIPRQNGGIFI